MVLLHLYLVQDFHRAPAWLAPHSTHKSVVFYDCFKQHGSSVGESNEGAYEGRERAGLGLAAQKAAKAIGVHENVLPKWEKSKSEPRGESLAGPSGLMGPPAALLHGPIMGYSHAFLCDSMRGYAYYDHNQSR